jgi:trehalose/maltose hydrolase-like predicted phosphorylase
MFVRLYSRFHQYDLHIIGYNLRIYELRKEIDAKISPSILIYGIMLDLQLYNRNLQFQLYTIRIYSCTIRIYSYI